MLNEAQTSERTTRKMNSKMYSLYFNCESKALISINPKTVVNLACYSFVPATNILHVRVVNLTITSKRIPKKEIITAVDLSIRPLPKIGADKIRIETIKVSS